MQKQTEQACPPQHGALNARQRRFCAAFLQGKSANEAARSAGAGGGTVIHAKGTGMEGMGKFFGVSLAAEKEMIFIVTERGQKQAIMRAIMEKAGMESKARTFLFSVPVDEVAGLDTSSR